MTGPITFVLRAALWGASVGLAGGLLLALENVYAHRYVPHGLGALAIEAARAPIYDYVLPVALATVVVAGLFAVVPPLRPWRGFTLWLTPWLLLATLIGPILSDLYRSSQRPPPYALRDALIDWLRLSKPSANLTLLAGTGVLGLLFAILAYRAGRWGAGREGWKNYGGPGRMAIGVLGASGLIATASIEVGLAQVRARPKPPGPNVVLISVDTVRADHLGCYGRAPSPSPRLDRLAATGVRFEHAISQAPWTMPAMATMLTSLYPSQHRANSANSRLSRAFDTLAEVLRNAGYTTMAVVSHVFVDKRHGFSQGFVEFDEQHILGHDSISSHLLTRTALAALEPKPKEPFFLWVHYFDPHYSYIRHPQYGLATDGSRELGDEIAVDDLEEATLSQEDIDFVRSVYDEEIAYTDEWIGRLTDGLEKLETTRPVIYVFGADHGEYFQERGTFGHGRDVYDELIHTPLIIGGDLDEDLRGRVVTATVENAQIPATVLGLAGLEHSSFHGPDLLSLARGETQPAPCFSEGAYPWGSDRKLALVYAGWKLIRRLDDRGLELYRLTTDPDERMNLIHSEDTEIREVLEQYMAQLDRFDGVLQDRPGGTTAENGLILDNDELEHLRSLGYVE